jgi:hypothetical protein
VSTGANTFRCNFGLTGQILFDYGPMTAQDGLVGCSPGSNLDPVGAAVNLSLSNNAVNPGSAVYELFTASSPNDVTGFQVLFLLDGSGRPILQL